MFKKVKILALVTLLTLIAPFTQAAQQIINNGESGLVVRTKLNSNTTELYTNLGSGVLSWTGTDILSINADTTKFDIAEIKVAYVDRSGADPENYARELKTFSAQTAVIATYLTSNVGTWLGYNAAGIIVQSPTEFTPEQRNTIVQIGRLSHFGKTVITGTYDFPWVYETPQNWAVSQASMGAQLLVGAELTANGANLKTDRSAGNFIRIGAGSTRNAINFPQTPSAVQVSMIPAWNSATYEGILGSATTDIDPTHYDDRSGTLQDIGAGKYANIFILHFPYKAAVTTFFIYGNKDYDTLASAEQGAFNREYSIPSDLTGGAIIASISVLKETTDLTAAIAGGTATIKPSILAGGGGGSVVTYWSKVGTDLSPATPGDNIKLLTGDIILGDATIKHENVTHDPVYLSGQTGLNDLSSSGTYSLTGNAVFQIRVDGVGSPNTFEWRKGTSGSYTSGIAMTGSAQVLQDGISITWAAITGHTNNDGWEINVGHEIHISEAIHIADDITADGDIVVVGTLRSLSPVKIQEGLFIKGTPAKISTEEVALEFAAGTSIPQVTLELDGTLAVNTTDYEDLVTSDDDIPNKKFVEDSIINKATGWLWGGEVTINTGDDTLVDITAGAVQIVTGTDNPIAKIISWDNQVGINPALASYTNWIGVKDDGFGEAEFIFQILFDSVERRTTALLGKIRDNAGTGPSITNIDDFERPAWGIATAFHDFVLAHGSFSVKGNNITASATDPLRLNKSAGESFRYHTEDTIGRENHHIDAAQLPRTSYDYHIQGSSQLVNHTEINPNLMDDGAQGTVAVSINKFTRQEIRIWPVSGAFHMTYGQTEFNSLQAAIDAGPEPMADINTKMTNGAIHIASLVIQEGTTNILTSLGSGTQIITLAGGGGGSGGGGISHIVEDVTPQLGGDLDGQTFGIDDVSHITIGSDSGSYELSIFGSKASAVEAQLWNTLGTDLNAHATLSLIATDTGGGDPYISFGIANVNDWSLGIDNSDSDKFKIGTSAILGTSNIFTLTRDGYAGFGDFGTSDPDRMIHVKGANANIHIERESADGATLFFSNINGSNTTHWKTEVLNNGSGAGSGILVIADDGTDSGGVSTTRVIVDENGHMSLGNTLPATDAALDIKSTTAAFMPPRMTTTQRDALTASNGMMVYNTTTNQFEGYENDAWVDL